MQLPKIIGINHSMKSPDALASLDFISQSVKAGDKVAIESPFTLEEIAKLEMSENSMHKYLHNLNSTLNSQGAIVVPVENQRLYRFRYHLKVYFMFDEQEVHDTDWRVRKTTIMASHSHLALAVANSCSTLVVGSIHAYHMQLAGCPNVHQTSLANPRALEAEQKVFEKYGSNLSKYVCELSTRK